MSAIRASHNRAAERKKRAAPYGRSIFSTIGRYIGDFLGATRTEDDESASYRRSPSPPSQSSSETIIADQEESPKVQPRAPQPPQASLNIFRDDRPTIYARSPPPQSRLPLTPVRNNLANPSGPGTDMTGVASILSQTAGRTISAAEAEEVIRRLRRSTPPPDNEGRFRFSATPSRESTPAQTAAPSQPTAAPRKTLARNPNGTYKWQGAGSAKQGRRRNRYGSPAFGVTPAKQERPTESDGKRRKLDQETTAFSTDLSRRTGSPEESRTLPFPIITTPSRNNNGIANKPPAPVLSPTSRLRTPVKPTVPVIPSPLRQAWSETSSASSQDRQSPSQSSKPSKTANFMAELIKETTPPKKPDVSNPYQTASPVAKVGPPRRASRRLRTTGKPGKPAEGKQAEEVGKSAKTDPIKDLAPEAIIEATLPKGSKRSRPPANLLGSSSSSESNGVPTHHNDKPLAIVAEEEENESRVAKKPKPSLVSLGPIPESATLPGLTGSREIEEAPKPKEKTSPTVTSPSSHTPTSTISPGARSAFVGAKPSSVPKEPSKLRFSIQVEASTSSSTTSLAPSPVTTLPPIPEAPKFNPPSTSFTFLAPPQPAAVNSTSPADPKSIARDMATNKLPTYSFTTSSSTSFPSSPEHVEARRKATETSASSLPKYTFGAGAASSSSAPVASSSALKLGGSSSPFPSAPSSSSLFGTTPSSSSSAAPAPKTEIKAFDFAAAGMKLKAPATDSWACDLCGISNASSASQCQACESPNPSAPKETKAPAGGFDWAAAGMKAPSKSGWSCSLCGLTNPESAKICETCETPK